MLLSERSQTEEAVYCVSLQIHGHCKEGKTVETEKDQCFPDVEGGR